jgi:hypothetical protein
VRQVRISTEKIGKRAERMEELQLGEPAADVAAVETTTSLDQRRLMQ